LRLVACSTEELTLEVTCSKGTYIRALARDIAVCLGTVGHLTSLVRTRVGHFTLDDAVSLDRLADDGVEASLQSPRRALPDAPDYGATPEEIARLVNGQAIAFEVLRAESLWVYDPSGRVVCLASADGSLLHPRLLL
jgi:tRNA pseudouridine55 synthase